MNNKTKSYNCWVFVILSIILLLLCAITIPSVIHPYFYGLNLEEITCYINNIEYPTTPPSFSAYENWESCDCGRRCSSYSPCIKLYTNVSNNIIFDKYPKPHNYECTFHEEDCNDGEDIRIIQNYLNESQEIYNSYINTTQTCYIDPNNGKIYLEVDTSIDLMITSLVLIGLLLTCCAGCAISNCLDKRKKNITNNPV